MWVIGLKLLPLSISSVYLLLFVFFWEEKVVSETWSQQNTALFIHKPPNSITNPADGSLHHQIAHMTEVETLTG